MYVLTEYVLTESFIMDWIGEKFGYWRQVRLIREYVLSRVRLNRVLLYLRYNYVSSNFNCETKIENILLRMISLHYTNKCTDIVRIKTKK